MPNKPILRRDIKPGLIINHLGTLYEVVSTKGERATVVNPENGFRATVHKSMLTLRSKRAQKP